jgi:hypothetical protein
MKEQMVKARGLIQQKRYEEARLILQQVDHPIAIEWLNKLPDVKPSTQKISAPTSKRSAAKAAIFLYVGLFIGTLVGTVAGYLTGSSQEVKIVEITREVIVTSEAPLSEYGVTVFEPELCDIEAWQEQTEDIEVQFLEALKIEDMEIILQSATDFAAINPPSCEIAQIIYDEESTGMMDVYRGLAENDDNLYNKGFHSIGQALSLGVGYLHAKEDMLESLRDLTQNML